MGKVSFDEILCLHCAPTFAGLKPASLVSFPKKRFADFSALLASYMPCFRCKGISVYTLAEGEEYILLLFYRKCALEHILSQKEVQDVLVRFGFCIGDSLENHLDYLAMRMELSKSFPHEVGIFLGYPVKDVEGFIEHKGKKFSFAGYWKVYADEEAAKCLFQSYADCTERFCARLRNGIPMEELLLAV